MNQQNLVQRARQLLASPMKTEEAGPSTDMNTVVPMPPLPAGKDWRATWREMAALTTGLTADDARLPLVVEALQQAARAEDAGDRPGFERAIKRTRFLMRFNPGVQIEWQRAGTVQHGQVDYVHVDAEGVVWAFVTIGESWAVVNLKFATLVEEGGQS